jgi:hypothetical protein
MNLRAPLLALAILLAIISVSPAHAITIADPDSMTLESVRAYDGVINAGDMLVVVQYDIQYTVLPVLAVTDAFLGRFMVAGVEVNAVEPIAFNDIGYGLGVFSLYFTASDKDAASIEFDNPNAEDYQIRLQGKPSAFVDPPVISTTSITYRSSANTASLLLADSASLAESLENNAAWLVNGLDLITFTVGQKVLTSTGEAYFGLAIPNLQIMIPDLFGSSTTAPEVFERSFGTSEQDRLLELWDTSPMGPIFTGLATELQIGKTWVLGILGIIGVAGAVFLASRIADPEYGLLTIPFSWPLMVAAGLGSMSALFFTVALAIIGLFYALFLRRAS